MFGSGRAAHLIDNEADRVNANYESCHVGETIIPALKEETHVQQAASYASDSAAKYCIKGVANNDYKLTGQMKKSNTLVSKGADTHLNSMSLHGNLQKKYSQHGNKELGCGCDANGFGLSNELLDEAATEVCADPEAKVNDEVEKVVRQSISKLISQAVQYCMDESLGELIDV